MEIHMTWFIVSTLMIGYVFTFLGSTLIVRKTISFLEKKKQKIEIDTGFIIGICENFIIVTFILIEEITGLALIFAAKTIVRRKDIERDPRYYLVGTMINFTFSVFMGIMLKLVLTLR